MGSGADWLRSASKDQNLSISPLGEKVADLLDAVWQGIYHLPHSVLRRVSWEDDHCITIVVPDHGLATYDFDLLTRLVVLCHDAAIRMELSSANPRNVRLTFHQRVREGRMSQRHPTIEQAVEMLRGGRR